MRFLAAAVAALVIAAPASADRVTVLQRQVAQLQRQVVALQKAVTLERDQRVCDYALGQDTFRLAVFPALDQFSIYITGKGVPAWEQIPRFDDKGACAAVGVTRP